MSFILDPFIFAQLEKFYERILTMPYTHDAFAAVAGSVIRTSILTMPYTFDTYGFDMSVESFKIVNIPYTHNAVAAVSGSVIRTSILTMPYTTEFTVT